MWFVGHVFLKESLGRTKYRLVNVIKMVQVPCNYVSEECVEMVGGGVPMVKKAEI